jgi:histidine decarboxylase
MSPQITRRRFLAFSGAGLLASTSGCRPVSIGNWFTASESDISHPALANKPEIARFKHLFLGYPVNMTTPAEAFFDWRKELSVAGIGQFAFNNVGNPFTQSPIPFNTHDFEREIIKRFADIYGFAVNDNWGFLSHSGTDSNMHGMYMGRTLLKGRTGIAPKVYFTRESHYSIQILRDLLGMETVLVDTLADGGMDSADLSRKLVENANQPALVVATIGTTFKGAIDNIDQIQLVLRKTESFLHLDAALFGGYLPHTDFAQSLKQQNPLKPGQHRYDSIAVSCHKFFGFPSPAGLFITRQKLFDEFTEQFARIHNPEYIHHVPGTITCSRDAVKPAEFYYFSTPASLAKQAADANTILHLTDKFFEQMRTHLPQWKTTRANNASNTLYFRKPKTEIVEKYSLATMHLDTKSGPQDYAHVVIMPHVNNAVITEFLTDLKNDMSIQA